MKKIKLPVLIGISTTAAAVIAAVCVILFMNRPEEYRIIKVYEFEGEGTITRKDIGEITPYSNMVLEAGDNIYFKQGTMTLRLDEDKYVYVENDTEFAVHASGSPKNSKTKIELKRGAIINELQNKLSNDSSYEVNTPNSTMSVRGTTFRVEVYYDVNGVCYTKVTVLEGKVETWLVYPDGSMAETSVPVEAGKEVIIYKDDVTTDYLTGVRAIQYGEFTEQTMELLHMLEASGTISLEVAGSVSSTDEDDETETINMTLDESMETTEPESDESTLPSEQESEEPTLPSEQESEEPTLPSEQESEEPTLPSEQESEEPTLPSEQQSENPSENPDTSEEETSTKKSEEGHITNPETTTESAGETTSSVEKPTETTVDVTETETVESTEETTEEETSVEETSTEETSTEETSTEETSEEETSVEETSEEETSVEETTEEETSVEETTEEETSETTTAVYTVTFRYNGTIFGTQKVEDGGFAKKPKLVPALTGSWDFDFGTPITEDTVIEWK